MHRGRNDDHFSAKHNTSSFAVASTIEGEKQKQKKRLSFKEPEIEPRQNVVHKPITQNFKPSFVSKIKDTRSADLKSLDDLTLEDQALQIVKHVGQAFENPRKISEPRDRLLSALPVTELTKESHLESKRKAEVSAELQTPFKSTIKQSYTTNQKISEKTTKNISENSTSSTPPTAMRCPVIEIAAEDADKTAGAEEPEAGPENIRDAEHMSSTTSKLPEVDPSWPTAARHQIQLLNFRLEQQRQQTKTAMSQIQLFKDQLEAESSARYQAQVQNQQLMNQNKELVNQIQQLFQQIQNLEKQIETCKKSSETAPQVQDSKQASLATPLSGYRRNSASLWSALTPTLIGRRNSATLSPTPAQSEPSQKFLTTDSFSRRTSITDDLATISSISKFGGASDWRLRRRGSSNLNLDFPAKTKINNGFNAIEDPSPSPIDRAKITPLFSPTPRDTMALEVSKTKSESRNESALHPKTVSLLIDESSSSECNSMPNLWSERSFRPIEPDGQRIPKKPTNKEPTTEKQSLLTKSLETLRLFNS